VNAINKATRTTQRSETSLKMITLKYKTLQKS